MDTFTVDVQKHQMALTKSEAKMLWDLLNIPQVAAPGANARTLADLYDKAKAAAEFFGLPIPPNS